MCACTRALRAVLRPECGHSALNGFHSQNGLLEASGRREAKPSELVQPEEDVDRRPQLCGRERELKGEPGMGSQEAQSWPPSASAWGSCV